MMEKFTAVLLLFTLYSCSFIERKERLPASFKDASCFERISMFQELKSQLTDNELENALKEAVEKFALKDITIDRTGRIHERFSEVELSDGKRAKIYGRSFLEDNRAYFNVQLDESPILKKMSAIELFDLSKEQFQKKFKVNDYVFLPLLSQGEALAHYYGAWKIMDFDEHSLKLRHRKGNRVEVTWEQLFSQNIVFNKEEHGFMNAFFSAGGRGEIFFYDSRDIYDLPYIGTYVYVQKLPDFDKLNQTGKELINDKKTYDDLVELRKSKTSFVLTNARRKFLAAHTGDHSSFAKKLVSERGKFMAKGHLIFTPSADRAIIKHELRHYYDHKLGLFEKFDDELLKLQERGMIPESAVTTIKKFVLEQRAYATEIDFSHNASNFDDNHMKMFKTSMFEMELKEPLYYQSRADQAFDTFRVVYVAALKMELRALGPLKARMLAHKILPHCLESNVLGCQKILSEFLD